MDQNSSNGPFSPRQKTLQTFVFEGDLHLIPKPTITTDILSEEADPGHLPETSLKLIREWIRKPTIEEAALKQYKTPVSRVVSTKAPFTEKDLKHFHQQVLREILSSFDSTYKDVLSSNPSLSQELQQERDKLKSAIKTQSRTFLTSYKTSIDTIKSKLKQCTTEAENAYMEDMEHSLKSVKSIDEIHSLHGDWKTKAVQIFSDTLREKTSLEVEPWMTQELKSRLEDKLEIIEEEFWDLKIASAYSASSEKSLQTDYIIYKVLRKFENDKLKDLVKNSTEEHVPDKIKQFLQSNHFDKLINDKLSYMLQEKSDKLEENNLTKNSAEKLISDKLEHFLESNQLHNLIEDKQSNIVQQKLDKRLDNVIKPFAEKVFTDQINQFLESNQLDKLIENKVSTIVTEKVVKLVEDKIVDKHLTLQKEIEMLNSRVNATEKHLIFKANVKSFDKASKQDYIDVTTKIDNLKNDSDKNVQTLNGNFEGLKNRFDQFQKEHTSKNVFIKSDTDAIKNVKADNIDVVQKLAKLENDMNTLNKNQVKQDTIISQLIQTFRSSETTVQKLQIQSPSLEHQHKNQENGIKHPNFPNKVSTPNTTSNKPLSRISKTQVSKTTTTSTVSKPLIGGLAKSTSTANNAVNHNANGKQMRPVVNQWVSKFQQQGQVTTAKVTGIDRQMPASRDHSTINLVLEEKSNPSTSPIVSVADRKSFFDGQKSPHT